jgi:hypothetical protein
MCMNDMSCQPLVMRFGRRVASFILGYWPRCDSGLESGQLFFQKIKNNIINFFNIIIKFNIIISN